MKIRERVAALDWLGLSCELDDRGFAVTPPLLTAEECAELTALWPDDKRFRKRIDMASHAFGEGAYGYFAPPLPTVVRELRTHFYRYLAPIANRWAEAMRMEQRYPATLAAYLRECHAAGQTRPTPLLLRYEAGGYNCLHRDLYGPMVFPLQLTCFLGGEHTGGEFVLVEQRPRAQSKAEVIVGRPGECVIFAVRDRPARGKRGYYRAGLRHGVARIRSGERWALGIIFHDAA